MTRALIRAKRIGGSIMARIPKEIAEKEDIREGDLVEIEVTKARRSWFGSMPDIPSMSREDELDTHG